MKLVASEILYKICYRFQRKPGTQLISNAIIADFRTCYETFILCLYNINFNILNCSCDYKMTVYPVNAIYKIVISNIHTHVNHRELHDILRNMLKRYARTKKETLFSLEDNVTLEFLLNVTYGYMQ